MYFRDGSTLVQQIWPRALQWPRRQIETRRDETFEKTLPCRLLLSCQQSSQGSSPNLSWLPDSPLFTSPHLLNRIPPTPHLCACLYPIQAYGRSKQRIIRRIRFYEVSPFSHAANCCHHRQQLHLFALYWLWIIPLTRVS